MKICMESGKFYHIYNRGNNRETIFKEVKNYYFFLQNFQNYLQNYIDIFSYCLMPNHFHFLIKIKEFESSIFIIKKLDNI